MAKKTKKEKLEKVIEEVKEEGVEVEVVNEPVVEERVQLFEAPRKKK